ncbi:MAG: universal stress protein [Thermoplasmata archaeon]|nr:universal stress protein [Thermoplasmata archaeon]
MKFDKVLVPIDGSSLSEVAVDLAVHSAGTFAAHITFVYVVDVTEYNRFGSIDGGAMISFRMQTEGKMFLENAAAMAKAAGLEVETQLIEGVPHQVLSDLSKDHDMIIMGVTGKSGGYGRVGGTAEKVIENAYCPVLTLKSGSNRIESVLLPVSNKNNAAIDVAIETVKRINGKLTVYAVKSKDFDAETLVKDVADKCVAEGINVVTEIGVGNPAEMIINKSGLYDLVVMGTEGRHGFKKILNGSVAEKVMLHATCPVTIVRDTE